VPGANARHIASVFSRHLGHAGFEPVGEPLVRDVSRFFSADLAYDAEFGAGQGLRAHVRVEMSFEASELPPAPRAIGSLIANAQREPPEVASFPCVDPVETAADKLSALTWRVLVRDRTRPNDDRTKIRHLHDLAALEQRVAAAPRFAELVLAATAADEGRGRAPATDLAMMFAEMLRRLETDPLWA